MPNTDLIQARIQQADLYFNEHLDGQIGWYDQKATKYKKWHKQLGLVVLVAGALTAVIPIWTPPLPDSELHWTTITVSLLGALVVLAKGVERIWAFDDNWSSYRQASEAMKREQRLYINAAGNYANINDESIAYRQFVERIEAIIQTETQTFWNVNLNEKIAEEDTKK